MSHYTSLERAHLLILRDYLEARLIACEVWRTSLDFALASPTISTDDREKALQQRGAALVEWGEVMTELHDLRQRDDDERALMPRAELN